MRKVINKMVTEEDLIRTVTTAYASGWRQVKLYFMCGLPTETDEDVTAIAALARRVIKAGRDATGRRDIRCTVSIGAFVPKPHTPFQWAGQTPHETVDARLRSLGAALRADPGYGRAVGYRYHDGKPSIIEGLLSRGDRRVAAVIRTAWERGARFDGWSEHFSFDRWADEHAGRSRRSAGRPGLVHDPGAGLQRGAPLGPPRRRAGPRLALAGLAGRGGPLGRAGGRRLPLDARVSTAASAPPWAPRSRPGRPARRCCRCRRCPPGPACERTHDRRRCAPGPGCERAHGWRQRGRGRASKRFQARPARRARLE